MRVWTLLGAILCCYALVCSQLAFADEETEESDSISTLALTTQETEDGLDLPAWALEDEDILVFRKHISEAKEVVAGAEKDLEKSEADATEARKRVEELQQQIEDMKETIAGIESQLIGQKQKSADALKLQYKLDSSGFTLTDLIISSTTLNDFMRNLEYMNHLQELNIAEIERYAKLKAEHERAQEDLETTEASAAEEERVAQAKVSAAQGKLEEAKQGQAKAEDELAAEIDARNKAIEATGTIDDNVDWSLGHEGFVKEWAERIDAYLAGSPLAGNGKYFAEAAWTNHIDPRWSPAISCVESGKGSSCFLPYNAWGWGQSSWSSWEDAIKEHVAGLSRYYGYSVTLDRAMKYCPPNAAEWYVQCVGEMRLI